MRVGRASDKRGKGRWDKLIMVGKQISKRNLPLYLPGCENQGCYHRPYDLEAQKWLHSLIRQKFFGTTHMQDNVPEERGVIFIQEMSLHSQKKSYANKQL